MPSRDDWESYIDTPLPVLPDPERREELRKQVGLSIEKAGRRCGVTRITFRKWELGEWQPSPAHHRRYAHLLAAWEKSVNTLG